MGGVSETSIECQLYFWILKSYQHGTRIGGERDSRPKHITAWTKNPAEKFAYICIRPRACVCVRVRLCAWVCVQKIKRMDAKNFCIQTRLLFKDFRDVLYSNPDLWVLYNCNIFSISYLITTVLAYLENVTQCITDYSVKMTGMVLTSVDSSVVAML